MYKLKNCWCYKRWKVRHLTDKEIDDGKEEQDEPR